MSMGDRTERVLDRAARGEADIGEIEDCISATRADLDRNLSAIEQRFSTEGLIRNAVDYFQSTPGEFFSNFGGTVKRNPVPTALLGVSLGWLMLASRRDNTSTQRNADAEMYGEVEVYNGAESADEDVSAVNRVREAMRSTKSSVADRASHVASQVHKVDDHARQVFQRTREQVARARRLIAQQPKRVSAEAHDIVQHHPFIIGAIAFAAGAAIAASMKRSRLEDELIGGYRDQAYATVEERARTELERHTTSSDLSLDDAGKDESRDHEGELTRSLEVETSDEVTRSQSQLREARES